MTFFHSGQLEESLPWLRSSIDLAPGAESHVRQSYALLGSALAVLGRNEEALAAVHLAHSALAQGDVTVARNAHADLRRLTGLGPDWTDLGLLIARCTGGDEERFLRETLQGAPYMTAPKLALAKLLLSTGRVGEAVKELSECAHLESLEGATLLAEVYERLGDVPNAIAATQRALEIQPGNVASAERLQRLGEPSPVAA